MSNLSEKGMKQKLCCVLLALALGACGNKGDLYIPKEPAVKSQNNESQETAKNLEADAGQDDLS